MNMWRASAFNLDDNLNQVIWSQSPALQVRLDVPRFGREGDVGAVQALVGPSALPWVPDLVGCLWQELGAVLVVGSAYANFFSNFARRDRRMNIATYQSASQSASGAATFQRAFLCDIVAGDRAYYKPVGDLLLKARVPTERVVLTDLCRASFVGIRNGISSSKEKLILIPHAGAFERYVDANADWHLRRLEESGVAVIVALGNLAARGVMRLLVRAGWTTTSGPSSRQFQDGAAWVRATGPPWTTCNLSGSTGRTVTILRVPHPGARGDACPADGAHVLAALLKGAMPSGTKAYSSYLAAPCTVLPQSPSVSTSAINLTDRDALWRAVFVPAKPLAAAVLLGCHPDANQYTRQLITGMSAARVVAIANALYNPCRPDRLSSTGGDSIEEAWHILLARQDRPYDRPGTKWARLVSALEPIPDWAVSQLRGMDIVQLGSTAQALVSGPYRAM